MTIPRHQTNVAVSYRELGDKSSPHYCGWSRNAITLMVKAGAPFGRKVTKGQVLAWLKKNPQFRTRDFEGRGALTVEELAAKYPEASRQVLEAVGRRA